MDGRHESHVELGGVLITFAEAIDAREATQITAARQALVDVAGELAMVDAAGGVSNFERNVRVADGTGIPLGEGLEGFSNQTRDQLGLNKWRTN